MTEIGSSADGPRVDIPRSTDARSPGSDSVERGTTEVATPPTLRVIGNEGTSREGLIPDLTRDPLEQAAELLEEFIPEVEQVANTSLRIDKDEETGRFVYFSIDDESGEVVRQFPPENILEFLSYYRGLEGLLLDEDI